MGVGAGLYMCDVVKKVHVRYLISWWVLVPSLDAMISCRIKKAVVGVTQLITALISIHSSMTFFADMYSFLDPPGGMVLFSGDDRSLFPVDCMIGLIRMVGKLVPEENFWTLWYKGRLTEADTETIWLGTTPSGLTSDHLHYPPFFYRCPFCRPTNSMKALKATSAFGLGRRR